LQYISTRGFDRILRRLHPNERMEIQRHVDAIVRAFESRGMPMGFGLKKLAGPLREFHVNPAIRILFRWDKQTITFLIAGNHNEVRQFTENYL